MNPDDYDEDGNNIVPCPICLNRFCPSKEDGKCPEEDEFVAALMEGKIKSTNPMSQNKSVEEVVGAVMKRIETEVEHDATQWNNMLVWEAGDYDIVFDIIKHAIQQERQTSQEREREIVKRLSRYTEHSHRCFLFTADTDEYDHAKCDCGLTEILTNPNKD